MSYCSYAGYWSYVRLVWLYRSKLNDSSAAIKWCKAGLLQLRDRRFVQELMQIENKYPESIYTCILVLEEWDAVNNNGALQDEIRGCLVKLYRKSGDEEKAEFYESLIR